MYSRGQTWCPAWIPLAQVPAAALGPCYLSLVDQAVEEIPSPVQSCRSPMRWCLPAVLSACPASCTPSRGMLWSGLAAVLPCADQCPHTTMHAATLRTLSEVLLLLFRAHKEPIVAASDPVLCLLFPARDILDAHLCHPQADLLGKRQSAPVVDPAPPEVRLRRIGPWPLHLPRRSEP